MFSREWPAERATAADLVAAVDLNSPVLHEGKWRLVLDWEREPEESSPSMWLWPGAQKQLQKVGAPDRWG